MAQTTQYAAYTWDTCPTGLAVYGVTTNILVDAHFTPPPCPPELLNCAYAGSFSESEVCSNGSKDVVNQMIGPVVTMTVYSDAACGSPLQTVAAVLDKCISMVRSEGLKSNFNGKFTISNNGSVGVTMYDDGDCKVPSKNQTPNFPKSIPGCEVQATSVIGLCDKVSAECVNGVSKWYEHATVGSFKYEQVVSQVAKSSALSVGVSLFSFVAALLMF
ncbi:hypothetical protein HDU79_008050 [Rhizoclosmatium sp. JEL0117]|nr:hypothetical protein HDU79_008050 [Rhizoclosmatium sp. JEL0117]